MATIINSGKVNKGSNVEGTKVKKEKRRGRPPVFSKGDRRKVSKYLRRFGLTHGVSEAAKGSLDNGVGVSVSVPTAIKIAKEYGVEFTRGRPCKSE